MGQQQEAWIEYQAASDKDKKMFFDGHLNVSDTLHRYMDLASNKMTFKVKASIVYVTIEEMVFRNDIMMDLAMETATTRAPQPRRRPRSPSRRSTQ